MNKHIPFAVISAVALLGTATVAFAQTGPGMPPQGGGRPTNTPHMASTTIKASMGRPTTTPMHGSSSPMGMGQGERGIPGVVTSVGTGSFVMTGRGLGGNASTSITVTVTAATKFFKTGTGRPMGSTSPMTPPPPAGSTTPQGSTTPSGTTTPPVVGSTTPPQVPASLADLKAGMKVEVFGRVATSTGTIAADRVLIGNANGPMMGTTTGSTSPASQGKARGFFRSLMNFFGFHSADNQGSTSTTSGAAPGFLDTLMSALFGWMH